MAFTSDWNPLGDVYFRKQELYSMGWADQVDLEKFLIAASPFAGPIALMRDESIVPKSSSTATKPIIYLFTPSGKELNSIRWTSGTVVKLGWSHTENLLCVQDDGTVLEYDIFGTLRRQFSMGQEAKNMRVKECEIFNSYNGTGVAILTSANRIYVINNVEDVRLRRLAEIPGIVDGPSSWVMLNQDRQSRALVANNTQLYLLDHGGQYQELHPPVSTAQSFQAYTAMAVSFNNKYLAMFTDSGLLWIGSSDLQKVYCEFDTKSQMKPQQLVWCGTGAILGYWDKLLLMVGPHKDWVKFSYDTHVHIVPEMDGVRILGQHAHEFLQRVPPVVEHIFKIGSMAPGAMLYEASREFQKGSQRADEYIRMIKDKLDEAVEQCIEAAGHEWEPKTQKLLLRAASFGKCFLTDYQADKFVQMCQMLRVLNAVRDHSIGIPLTYTQLQQLSLLILIDRLVLRRHFGLAIEVCKYLKLPDAEGASRILAHWACFKVQQKEQSEEAIAQAIAAKLKDTPGVSYTDIANKAEECGRTNLAIRLLDYEPRAAEQVPLLMKLKKNEHALKKAIDSGDTDLVYTVVLQLKETMHQGDFLIAIRTQPTAYALFLQFCREQNRELLRDLYEQEDNYAEEAACRVWDSYQEERMDARLSCLGAAQKAYARGRNDWAAKQTEEQIKLLNVQRKLEQDNNRQYMDLSLHQTVFNLVKENNQKWSEQLRKDFRIPDRRFWWLKIQALAESSNWLELEKFSKSKKSPIGYEPFVEMCFKYGNIGEAEKYLLKVTPENKVTCLVKIGRLDQAAETAFQQKDVDGLNVILQKCASMNNRDLAERINHLKVQLGAR